LLEQWKGTIKMSIYEKLNKVQLELNAPKNLYNKFGDYHYRNCEGILNGLKPLLEKYGLVVVLTDEIMAINDRYYMVSTAKLVDIETGEKIYNTAYAREDETHKGLTGAQITGSSSSYARKYALNGLLAIDDVQDDDSRDNTAKGKKPATEISDKKVEELRKQMYNEPF